MFTSHRFRRRAFALALALIGIFVALYLALRSEAQGEAQRAEMAFDPISQAIPKRELLADAPMVERQVAEVGAMEDGVAQPTQSWPQPLTLEFLRQRYEGRALALPHELLEQQLIEPVEVGPCVLHVQLVDAVSGEGFASAVQLWRLQAPASETMHEGDQLIRTADVPIEGFEFKDLALGNYRAVVEGTGRTAPDPVAFSIEAERTALVLRVERPIAIPLLVAIFDVEGRRLYELSIHALKSSYARFEAYGPRWPIAMRKPKFEAEEYFIDYRNGGGMGRRFRGQVGLRTANAAGWFELGKFGEGDRRISWPVRLDLSSHDAIGATKLLLQPRRGETHWVSVVCTQREVLESLRMPDGRDGYAIAEHVTLRPQALAVDPLEVEQRWRDVPIEVSIALPEQPPVKFSFTARELPLPVRTLE